MLNVNNVRRTSQKSRDLSSSWKEVRFAQLYQPRQTLFDRWVEYLSRRWCDALAPAFFVSGETITVRSLGSVVAVRSAEGRKASRIVFSRFPRASGVGDADADSRAFYFTSARFLRSGRVLKPIRPILFFSEPKVSNFRLNRATICLAELLGGTIMRLLFAITRREDTSVRLGSFLVGTRNRFVEPLMKRR
jgi:hypothetical protein